jgi:hypothetical protein
MTILDVLILDKELSYNKLLGRAGKKFKGGKTGTEIYEKLETFNCN